MSEMLQKLRSQSDSSKNKFAIIFAAAITLVIVGLWIMVLKNQKTDEVVVEKSKSNELKPLFMIFKNAKEDFANVKAESKAYKASSIDAAPAESSSTESNMIE